MKLAISATGKDLDSTIDPGFGRTTYFLIVDAKSGDIVKVIDNSAAQNAGWGAGINAATIVSGSGAQVVLTDQVGPKASEIFPRCREIALTACFLTIKQDLSTIK